jgi:hypothetical protein
MALSQEKQVEMTDIGDVLSKKYESLYWPNCTVA